MPLEYKRAPLAVSETTEAGFAGHASIFGVPDDGTPPDVILPGAFRQSIADWGPSGSNRIKILALHRGDWLPIGKPVELREDDRGLYVRAQISQTTLGRDVLTLLRDGVLSELSIGFDPIVTEPPSARTPYRVIREARLWEISPVTWALHPLAKVEAVKQRVIGAVKSVPPDVSTELAPREAAWTAPTLREFTEEDWEALSEREQRRIAGHFAWAPEIPPQRFSDLKLPHHRPQDGRVVWRGVVAAMAALLGARGGVAIPAHERRAVYAHLAAHYRAFDAEPPEFHAANESAELVTAWRALLDEMRASLQR